jgi:hypothetical protein
MRSSGTGGARAAQALLLGVEGDDQQRVPRRMRLEVRGHGQQRRDARGIVVRAEIRLAAAHAEVVVMRGHQDVAARVGGARDARHEVDAADRSGRLGWRLLPERAPLPRGEGEGLLESAGRRRRQAKRAEALQQVGAGARPARRAGGASLHRRIGQRAQVGERGRAIHHRARGCARPLGQRGALPRQVFRVGIEAQRVPEQREQGEREDDQQEPQDATHALATGRLHRGSVPGWSLILAAHSPRANACSLRSASGMPSGPATVSTRAWSSPMPASRSCAQVTW